MASIAELRARFSKATRDAVAAAMPTASAAVIETVARSVEAEAYRLPMRTVNMPNVSTRCTVYWYQRMELVDPDHNHDKFWEAIVVRNDSADLSQRWQLWTHWGRGSRSAHLDTGIGQLKLVEATSHWWGVKSKGSDLVDAKRKGGYKRKDAECCLASPEEVERIEAIVANPGAWRSKKSGEALKLVQGDNGGMMIIIDATGEVLFHETPGRVAPCIEDETVEA